MDGAGAKPLGKLLLGCVTSASHEKPFSYESISAHTRPSGPLSLAISLLYSPVLPGAAGDIRLESETMSTATKAPTVEDLSESASQATDEAVDAVSSWWDNPLTQEWLVRKPIMILIILVIAIVGHWFLYRLIRRIAGETIRKGGLNNKAIPRINLTWEGRGPRLSRRQRQREEQQLKAMDKAREERRVSRIETLASVAQSAAGIFVWVWASLAILSEIGVNVAPLIASAGVAGVALGFGAQSLVKDFLSGIFMLLEDQYGIGDTIDLGNGAFGTVEEISLRITTVRDIDGALWYVRNGEILQVANHSDEYSVARIQIPVAHANDQDEVLGVIKEGIARGAQDEEISGLLLEEPQVQGISDFAVDHVSYRVVVNTLPGRHWEVQRVLQSAALDALNEHDIATPYPKGKAALFNGEEE